MDLHLAIDRVLARLGGSDRILIGVTGAPGAGKSTMASRVVDALNTSGVSAVVVPMDGFHLADTSLDRLGLRSRKGTPETFDPDGYVALLSRLRTSPRTVYAPGFSRDLEQPLAASVAVTPDVRVVVTEGNYLLLDGPWREVRELLDEVWYITCDSQARRQRLVARHIQFGKSPADAQAWEARIDEPNAQLVETTRPLADWVVDLDQEDSQ